MVSVPSINPGTGFEAQTSLANMTEIDQVCRPAQSENLYYEGNYLTCGIYFVNALNAIPL